MKFKKKKPKSLKLKKYDIIMKCSEIKQLLPS